MKRLIRRLVPKQVRRGPSRDRYIASPLPIERELLSLFSRTDALTVFDIGACEGEDSIRYARLFPAARVFAVEPLATNLEIARSLLRRYGVTTVTLLPFALSDSEGTAEFHVSSGEPPDAGGRDWDFGNKSSSLLAPDGHRDVHPWVRFDDVIQVPTRTLEAVARDLNIEVVDFIHLDVQGAELKVLEGAGLVLDTVRALWLEVEEVPLYKDQPLKDEVAGYLTRHGFRLILDTVRTISGDQLWAR